MRCMSCIQDYTGREERKIEAQERNADPILFGSFQDAKSQTVVERFYVLGDWEDEYCDLTLDKLVGDMTHLTGKDIAKKISTPEDINELRQQLNGIQTTATGGFVERDPDEAPQKKSFFARVRSWITGK